MKYCYKRKGMPSAYWPVFRSTFHYWHDLFGALFFFQLHCWTSDCTQSSWLRNMLMFLETIHYFRLLFRYMFLLKKKSLLCKIQFLKKLVNHQSWGKMLLNIMLTILAQKYVYANDILRAISSKQKIRMLYRKR